jgi:protein dithiol oxidoreductase (disulfide-forming)
MKRLLLPLLLMLFGADVAHAQIAFREGKQITVLKPSQPTESGDKVEVLEFFSFACGHCREFEPYLEGWKKRLPADVSFRRVPVGAFQPTWKNLVKVYFALDSLGQADALTGAVFEAIHRDGIKLNDTETFYAWAKGKGLDMAKLKAAYESFAVDSKLRWSDQKTRAFGVANVPTIAVDGKYVLEAGMLRNGHAAMPEAMDYLVGKARTERKP